MELEKNRHILMLLYFMEHRELITSQELAEYTGVSTRTIKTDISFINEYIKANGAEIISKKSGGYYLKVYNEKMLNSLQKKLEPIRYYNGTSYELDDFNRMSLILRKFLSTTKRNTLKIEELGEELFISKPLLRKDLEKCSKFLDSYNINIVSKPNYGTYIEGDEKNIRMAMLSAIMFSPLEDDVASLQSKKSDKIRKLVLKVMRDEQYTLREEVPIGLTRYIKIMQSRILEGKFVHFNEEKRIMIDQSRQMRISQVLFDTLKDILKLQIDEDEKRMVAVFLMINHDYKKNEDSINDLEIITKNTDKIYCKVNDFLFKTWGIKEIDNVEKTYLYSILLRINLRKYFGMVSHELLIFNKLDAQIKLIHSEMQLAYQLQRFIEFTLEVNLNKSALMEIAFLMHQIVKNIRYDRKKLKLATVSPLGICYADILIQKLNERYGEYILTNQAMELYEIRPLPPGSLDYVILDNFLLTYYKYDIPYIVLENRNITQLEQIFMDTICIDEMCEKLTKSINCYWYFDMVDKLAWFKMLAYKHAINKEMAEKMIAYFQQNDAQISYVKSTSVIILSVDYEFVKQDVFEIYKCSNKLEWSEDGNYDYLIFFAFDFHKNSQLLKMIMQILQILNDDHEFLERLMKQEKKENLLHEAVLRSEERVSYISPI